MNRSHQVDSQQNMRVRTRGDSSFGGGWTLLELSLVHPGPPWTILVHQLVPLPTNQIVSHNLLVLLGFVVAWRFGSIHCPAGGDLNHWWTLGDEADVCGTFGTVRAGLTPPEPRTSRS